MGKRDARVDAYIAKSADFAKPILTEIRDVVHSACPDAEEDLKWSAPAFMYKGMLCGMAGFKQHVQFGFWKHSLVVGAPRDGMGFGRLTKVSELPSKKTLTGYIKKAMALNDAGVKIERKPRGAAKPLKVPPDLAAALKKNKKAQATFDGFSRSHRNEYVEWMTEAKTAETRAKRLQQAVTWMAEGKPRNWKYMKGRS
jgi:uncharacterized protein YdeI (YjbR/CyaY-like superfamily)